MTESQALALLSETYDHIDPETGAPLWQLTAEDVLALEIALQDEEFGPDAYLFTEEVWA